MRNLYLTILTALFISPIFSQNSCNDALEIQAGVHTVEGINGEQAPDPPCQFTQAADNGMWYKYTPSDTFNLTVTSGLPQSFGTDTRLSIFSGSCDDLECVIGNDDGGGNLTSEAIFDVFPANTYFIAFDNRYTSSGFDFELIEGDYIAPPPPPPPVPTLFTFTEQPFALEGLIIGAVDMDGDFLDDIIAIQDNNVNVAIQTESALDYVSLPTPNAEYDPSWSLAAGDVDGNGWNDLVYGDWGGASIMMRSDDGESFDEQIISDIFIFSQRSNMVDINNDGNLDVFVCHDVEPNTYFINNGDGTMELLQGGLGDHENGGNYGSIWTDYDNDGDIDMFIAKCRGGSNTININEMHRNNGDGTYTEVGEEIGLADPVQTWSSAWGDYDNDGDMDVFVGASTFFDGSHKLMVNNGDGTFSDMTAGSGLENYSGTSIEWTTHDFDNDGYLDILGEGKILKNNGDFTFTVSEIDFRNGPVGDLNNDGFLDVVNTGGFDIGSTERVYLNDGNENNYLVVNTVGTESNWNGIGSRITVHTASFSQIREIRSGDGFEFMSSLNAYFGLGQDSEIDSVVVNWPSGNTDVVFNPDINTSLTIVEGSNPLSAESETETSLKVYPNPAFNDLFIAASGSLTGSRFDIFDVQGKRIQSGVLTANQIDVSTLQSGNYILQLTMDEVTVESKFYKE